MPASMYQAIDPITDSNATRPTRKIDPTQQQRTIASLSAAVEENIDHGTTLQQLTAAYLAPDLSGPERGHIIALIVQVLGREAHSCDPRTFGVDIACPIFRAIHRGMAFHLDQAVEEIRLIRRLQQNDTKALEAPKFVVGARKTGCVFLANCIAAMVKLSHGCRLDDQVLDYRVLPAWWDLDGVPDWDLRPSIGADASFRAFPGSVCAGPIPPTPKNIKILSLYPASRAAVMVRDPRDQAVAAYCGQRRARIMAGEPNAANPADIHAELDDFMRSGSLLDSIVFTGQWLSRRDEDRAVVVTLESILADPGDRLRCLAEHFQLPLSDEELAQVYRYAAPLTDRAPALARTPAEAAVYPFGWSGAPGIWKAYFSDQNRQTFTDVFNAASRTSPWTQPLAQLYPDLI